MAISLLIHFCRFNQNILNNNIKSVSTEVPSFKHGNENFKQHFKSTLKTRVFPFYAKEFSLFIAIQKRTRAFKDILFFKVVKYGTYYQRRWHKFLRSCEVKTFNFIKLENGSEWMRWCKKCTAKFL